MDEATKQRIAQDAANRGAVLLGSTHKPMRPPSPEQVFGAIRDHVQDLEARLVHAESMGRQVALALAALASVVRDASGLQPREDGSFAIRIDAARIAEAVGVTISYDRAEDGAIQLDFVPPQADEEAPADEPEDTNQEGQTA